jgi:hypothetical protein
MKFSLFFLSICVLSFILIYSCSTEEEEESVAPVVQTPQPEPEPETVQYSLTVSAAEGGTVSTEGGTYDEDSEVTITATANEGYRFTGWEGNNSTNESLTITLNSNQTYQALFELIPIYTLTVTTNEGGTVSTDGGEYQEGTEIEITATPSEGYTFGGWIGANSTTANLSININSNLDLEAVFINFNSINNDPLIYNYDTSKSYIGELVDFYPSAFFASDVPEYIRESVNIAIKTAADRYGKYGPVEFWSLGTEEAAAQELLNSYCERRDNLNHWGKQDCFIGREDDFLNSAKAGRDAIQNGECRVDGSHSGGFQWGFHDMRTTYLMGFDDSFECRPFGDDYFTIVHEYFHVVQLASVFNLSRQERNTRTKPDDAIWMMEGAAQYMGIYTVYKLQDEGISIFPSDKWTGGLRNGMKNAMGDGKYHFNLCPNIEFSRIKGSDNCRQAAYSLGAWAVAYLINKVGNQNILTDTFYPNLSSLGFEGAFNLAFGYSSEEFYEEFNAFLELPIEQQLEIIPDI